MQDPVHCEEDRSGDTKVQKETVCADSLVDADVGDVAIGDVAVRELDVGNVEVGDNADDSFTRPD